MKKTLLLFTISLFMLLAGCSSSQLPPVLESNSVISINEALSTLDELLSVLKPQTKSGDPLEIAEILTIQNSDIMPEASGKDIAYVVNFSEDEGFALLAADRNLPDPVIAIVENGTMDKNMKIHNTPTTKGEGQVDSTTLFLERLLTTYIINNEGGGEDRDDDTDNPYEGPEDPGPGNSGGSSSYSKVGPILNYYWHQSHPFNKYCPIKSGTRCLAGCVPVALAMILTYNRYPASLTLDGYTCQWDLMNSVYNYNSSTGRIEEGSSTGLDLVAWLIKEIGVYCDTYYTTSWSFTVPEDAKDFMKSIGYTNAKKHVGYDENDILPMLNAGKPVFIAAISGVIDGHAWVIDGYIKNSYRTLMHCNWGWGGSCNGYYVSKVFDTRKGPVQTDPDYDKGGTSSFDFDWWYRIITY